jgi:hypothetical protein
MGTIEDGRLLRIFIGEGDCHGSRPLYEAIVELLRHEGVAGATVVRGIAGFGRSSVVHTSKVLRMSTDLPIVIEAVDTVERISEVVPLLDDLIGEGLMTLERVEVHVYRGREPGV